MESLALKNPDDIKSELDSVSEEMSNALYDYRRCEEFKKITFSQLTLTKKLEKNCSVAEAEKWACTADEYKTIIEGLLVAEKNYSILKGKYANLQSWVDLYRSWLVTQRDLVK
jgi:uncharacterized Fe-S cluster-containing protein